MQTTLEKLQEMHKRAFDSLEIRRPVFDGHYASYLLKKIILETKIETYKDILKGWVDNRGKEATATRCGAQVATLERQLDDLLSGKE